MKVHVQDNLYITSDEQGMNYQLVEQVSRTLDRGKPEERQEEVLNNKWGKYFSSVENVLKFYLRLQIAGSNAKDIEELIADVQRIENMIKEKVGF